MCMKKDVIMAILVLISVCSCTAKKIQTQTKEQYKINEVLTEKTVSETAKSVDTTKIKTVERTKESNTETNSVKIDFFSPDEVSDYDKVLAKMRERGEPYSEYGIPKSITGTNIKANETQKGTAEETQKGISNEESNTQIDANKKINNDIKIENKVKTEIKPFWDKYKWYFIFAGIVVIVFLAIRYKLLSFIKRF